MYSHPQFQTDVVKPLQLESLMDLVQPGWRKVVIHRRFLPAVTVTNAIPTAAINGTEGRPSPQVGEVKGLFIVGDWVGS